MTDAIAGRHIALIGGAGFIGHHLALELARRGARVVVIDSLQVNNLLSFASQAPSSKRDLSMRILNERLEHLRRAGIQLHRQDARDCPTLFEVLGSAKPQVIVHLAAVSHADRAQKDPFRTFDHGLRTLENALEYARDGVEQFMFLSSSMAYGNFLSDTVTEDHPLDPVGIYGGLKVAGEKLVIAYSQAFKLPYTIVRPSALYGPRCVSRRVTQMFIEKALACEKLRVDGDGTERLDFTYIDDLVEGMCLAIARPEGRNETFNLTYGASRSLSDLVSILRSEVTDVEIERVERDQLLPLRGTLNIDKARRLLGYQPRFPLEIGYRMYLEWYRSFYASSELEPREKSSRSTAYRE